MSAQLNEWRGDFGRAYTQRNQVDWRTRVDTLNRLLPRDIDGVLEVGTNRGHNLRAIRHARDCYVAGVEPNQEARRIARSAGLIVQNGTCYAIPESDASFDLVLVSGVLIHVPPDRLDRALQELHRVSARYVLAVEYFSEQDTETPYRGMSGMMWKRDYGAHFVRVHPELRLVDFGDLGTDFDCARFWLMEKPQ